MSFVDYTRQCIETHLVRKTNEYYGQIVILGSECNINVERAFVHTNNQNEDICDFCSRYRNSSTFYQADLVIMSRVIEHLPLRQLDYYLYSVHSIMRKGGKLVCVVPDMIACSKKIADEFKRYGQGDNFDYYKALRLNLEIFSEGNNTWDRHSTWTDINSIRYYLEMEHLFDVKKLGWVTINTDLVPSEIEVIAESL